MWLLFYFDFTLSCHKKNCVEKNCMFQFFSLVHICPYVADSSNSPICKVSINFLNNHHLLLLKYIFELHLFTGNLYLSNILKSISRFPNTGQMFPISVLFGEIYCRPFSRSIAEFTNWPSADKSPHEEKVEKEIFLKP